VPAEVIVTLVAESSCPGARSTTFGFPRLKDRSTEPLARYCAISVFVLPPVGHDQPTSTILPFAVTVLPKEARLVPDIDVVTRPPVPKRVSSEPDAVSRAIASDPV
jgi:hypothetical protein